MTFLHFTELYAVFRCSTQWSPQPLRIFLPKNPQKNQVATFMKT